MSVVLEYPEYIADIDADAFAVALHIIQVRGQGFFVPIEGQSYQLPSAVQHRTAGIASRNVIVCDEIKRYGFTLALKQ